MVVHQLQTQFEKKHFDCINFMNLIKHLKTNICLFWREKQFAKDFIRTMMKLNLRILNFFRPNLFANYINNTYNLKPTHNGRYDLINNKPINRKFFFVNIK